MPLPCGGLDGRTGGSGCALVVCFNWLCSVSGGRGRRIQKKNSVEVIQENSKTEAKGEVTCEAGEGVSSGKIFTSGYASQCTGLSKITTREECIAAAEYNRKNNIDKNQTCYKLIANQSSPCKVFPYYMHIKHV